MPPAMPRSPAEMREAILRNVPAKTGREVDHWVALVRRSGLEKHMQKVALLKGHGVGHSTASVLVQLADGDAFEDAPEAGLVALQYAGARAALRPVYDAVRATVLSLGDDVLVQARRDYVAFSRRRQFAVARPSTRARVDLGLRLGHVAPVGRLQVGRNLGGGMIDRRVELTDPADVDGEVRSWLAQAYAGAS
jgi:predicted transport protein